MSAAMSIIGCQTRYVPINVWSTPILLGTTQPLLFCGAMNLDTLPLLQASLPIMISIPGPHQYKIENLPFLVLLIPHGYLPQKWPEPPSNQLLFL